MMTGKGKGKLFGALLLVCALLLSGCGRDEEVTQAAPTPPPATTPEATPTPPPPPPPPPVPATDPVRITVPAIGVDAQIVAVGLEDDGAMQTPDFGLAGWYTEGPRPGDTGPAVVVAHVDSRQGPDVFYDLQDLNPGDEITIQQTDGRTARFRVDSPPEQLDKDELPADRIWAPTPQPALRLITCGGEFDESVRHYTDNIIVFASALPA